MPVTRRNPAKETSKRPAGADKKTSSKKARVSGSPSADSGLEDSASDKEILAKKKLTENLRKQLEQLQSENTTLSMARAELQAMLTKLQGELSNTKTAGDDTSALLREAEATIEELRAELSGEKQTICDLKEQHAAAIATKNDESSSASTELTSRIGQLNKVIHQHEQENKKLNDRLVETEKERTNEEIERIRCQTATIEAQETITTKTEEIDALQRQLNEKNDQLTTSERLLREEQLDCESLDQRATQAEDRIKPLEKCNMILTRVATLKRNCSLREGLLAWLPVAIPDTSTASEIAKAVVTSFCRRTELESIHTAFNEFIGHFEASGGIYVPLTNDLSEIIDISTRLTEVLSREHVRPRHNARDTSTASSGDQRPALYGKRKRVPEGGLLRNKLCKNCGTPSGNASRKCRSCGQSFIKSMKRISSPTAEDLLNSRLTPFETDAVNTLLNASTDKQDGTAKQPPPPPLTTSSSASNGNNSEAGPAFTEPEGEDVEVINGDPDSDSSSDSD